MKNFIFFCLIGAIFSGCAEFRAKYVDVDTWQDCQNLAKNENWQYITERPKYDHIRFISPLGADVVCYAENESECVTLDKPKCYTKKVANNLYETSCIDKYTTCSKNVRLYKKTKP